MEQVTPPGSQGGQGGTNRFFSSVEKTGDGLLGRGGLRSSEGQVFAERVWGWHLAVEGHLRRAQAPFLSRAGLQQFPLPACSSPWALPVWQLPHAITLCPLSPLTEALPVHPDQGGPLAPLRCSLLLAHLYLPPKQFSPPETTVWFVYSFVIALPSPGVSRLGTGSGLFSSALPWHRKGPHES